MWGKAHQRKLLMHFSQLRRRSKSNVEGRLEGKSGSLKSVAAKTKFILLTDDKSDCGLLFPKSWSKLIRSVSISKYMCAATLGPYLFASLHLLWEPWVALVQPRTLVDL